MQSMLFCPHAHVISGSWIFGVDAAHAHKLVRVALDNVSDVAIVPSVVYYLYQDGFFNAVRIHQSEQVFGRPIFTWGLGVFGWPRKSRIVFPYVDVWIYDAQWKPLSLWDNPCNLHEG